MSYEVVTTRAFDRAAKKLTKKHVSFFKDISRLIAELAEHPTLGTPLPYNCFKIRLAIKSKARGKSGGARVITTVLVEGERVVLLDIYDKSERASLSDAELRALLAGLAFDGLV